MKASDQITQAINEANIDSQNIRDELGLYVETAKAHEHAALCWTTKGTKAWHSNPMDALGESIQANVMSKRLDDGSIDAAREAYRKALIAALAATELGTDSSHFQVAAKATVRAHEAATQTIQATAEFIIDDHKEW